MTHKYERGDYIKMEFSDEATLGSKVFHHPYVFALINVSNGQMPAVWGGKAFATAAEVAEAFPQRCRFSVEIQI